MSDIHFMTIFKLQSNIDLKLMTLYVWLKHLVGISQELNACALEILILELFPWI